MNTVKIIFVGGFLGAGKTSLLWQSAQRLMEQGKRVGLITNDQAPDLVDTNLLIRQGVQVEEVAGSCFCCNFGGLIRAAEMLHNDMNADILIAEPVGSCTDVSATLLQPLKEHFRQHFTCSPFSVVVDPIRLREVLGGNAPSAMHPSAAYIFQKQLQEADWIVVNKVDLLTEDERLEVGELLRQFYPASTVKMMSARTGEGVDSWLEDSLIDENSGSKVVEVDYDIYAEGEAVLGWLNAAIRLTGVHGQMIDHIAFCRDIMGAMQQRFEEKGAAIGHVKVLLGAEKGDVVCNLTHSGEGYSLHNNLEEPVHDACLIVNARVEMSPTELETIVRDSIDIAAGNKVDAEIREVTSMSPGRPNPTHRYDRVVE